MILIGDAHRTVSTARLAFHLHSPAAWLLCLCGLLAHGQSSAQSLPVEPARAKAAEALPEFDVERLQALVTQFNPGLRAAAQSLDAARAGIRSAGALPNPRVEWSRGPWEQQQGLPGRATAQSWTLTQPVENPWLRSARISGAEAAERTAQQQLAMVRNDLVAQLRTRVFEVLLHESEAEAATEALALLEQVQQRVRVRVSSGEAPRYELIKADAEVINARERQQTARLRAEQTLLEINRLAAGQLPARWRIQPGLAAAQAEVASLQQYQERAAQHNPELLGLKHELDRAQSRLELARASRVPAMDVRYTEMSDPQVKQSQWGVGLQIPLLDQRQGPIAEAVAELERARTRYEGRQAELIQQVTLAWRSYEMSRLRVEALSQGVLKEAESALRVAEAAYRFGERGILDVLDAQRVLRSVRADLLQARYQRQAARITLEQLSGRYTVDISTLPQ